MSNNALCVLWDNVRQLGSLYTICLIRNIITDNPALSTVSLIYGGRGVSLYILSQNTFNILCIVAMVKTWLSLHICMRRFILHPKQVHECFG